MEAYTEAATGQRVHLQWFLVRHRRLAAWLEARPEAVGNPFVGRQQVERWLSTRPTTLTDRKRWGWKVKLLDKGGREGSDGVPYGLIREWERQGFRVPDPRRAEDFELHVRLVEAALGIGDFRWPTEDSGSSGDIGPAGSEQSSIGNPQSAQSRVPNCGRRYANWRRSPGSGCASSRCRRRRNGARCNRDWTRSWRGRSVRRSRNRTQWTRYASL